MHDVRVELNENPSQPRRRPQRGHELGAAGGLAPPAHALRHLVVANAALLQQLYESPAGGGKGNLVPAVGLAPRQVDSGVDDAVPKVIDVVR